MSVQATYYAGGTGYTPADMLQRDSDWISPGVLSTSDLVVAQTVTASMGVTVSGAAQGSVGGNAWLPNGYRVYNDALATLTIAAADTTNPRIDLIVIGIDTTVSPYVPQLKVIKGTAAASPVAPSMPVGFVGLALAQVRVNANATTILTSNITDIRTIASLVAQSGDDPISTLLSDMMYQTAGGTATALTLTIKGTLVNGYPIPFIASADNGGVATTANNKSVYKPGTTSPPTFKKDKPYTIWYNLTGDCFFIKASAEGTALAKDVRKNTTFSNDSDTGIPGGLDLSLLVSGNIRAGVTIDGVTGATNVVDTTISANAVTAAMIRAGYKCFINGVLTAGTAAEKAATTYNPSTSQQVISAGQILTGDQTIAAITGTATDADVVSGKTYNSAAGILRTGTATLASLGGTQYAPGTVNHTLGTANTIPLPFTPRAILLTHSASGYAGYYFIATDKDTTNFYLVGSSGAQVYLKRTVNSIVLDANLPTGTTTYYVYA